jgi:homoserine kinase
MAFRRDPVRVVVPATSANLGPGFDCAGLALDIQDELIAMISDDEGVLIEAEGEGQAEVPRDASHLVARAMALAFTRMGQRPPGFILRCRNSIPHGRGLGSSAAAIVGGLVLARALVEDGPQRYPDDELLQWAVAMESHPDNVSAALHGGLTFAWRREDGRADCIRLDPHPDILPILLVPSEQVPTNHARTALPDSVPFSDAAFNLARASLLVHALTRQPSLLLEATGDRLHQQARRGVYPASLELVEALRLRGLPATISGAGPSVIVLGAVEDLPSVQELAGDQGEVCQVRTQGAGAHVEPVGGTR